MSKSEVCVELKIERNRDRRGNHEGWTGNKLGSKVVLVSLVCNEAPW